VKRLSGLIFAAAVIAAIGACGKKEETQPEPVAKTSETQPQTDETPEQLNPYALLPPTILDTLQVHKKHWNITRDKYWPEGGGLLANVYFEVWYPRGRMAVTHAMYVFDALMPARRKLQAYFGTAPGNLLVIHIAKDLDEYKKKTGRDWWFYGDFRGDTLTYEPVFIFVKRELAPMAINHEYYQWAIGQLSNHGAPRWLEEAYASYLSDEGGLLKTQILEFPDRAAPMPPREVEGILAAEEEKEPSRIAYYRSYRMLTKMMEDFGEDNVKRFVLLLGEGHTMNESCQMAFHLNYDQLLDKASDYTIEVK
jgi:hypothetical protein